MTRERREDGEVPSATDGRDDDGMLMGDRTAARAFERLARALSLAAEARSSGERARSSVVLDQVVKQYVGELDEVRATCERARRRADAEGSMDES